MELIASLKAETAPQDVSVWARRAEALGFDVLHVPETIHDSLIASALALEHTTSLLVRTSMVVAFPRSPMVTAYAAWDLARLSAGRFQLGIASQVRGNIVGRYSASWTDPVSQLADYIRSVRAIFAAFQSGGELNYQGPHYRFERLQPYFNPGPIEVAAPTIWTGGVNRQMCELAGELSDGFVSHPTASHPRYLSAHLRPAIEDGVARSGRADGGPGVVVNVRPLVGKTSDELEARRAKRREELGFLYSTPAYRAQLDLLGLSELGDRLTEMAANRQWEALADHLTDDALDRLLPQGTWAELPATLDEWYAGQCDGLCLDLPPESTDDDDIARLVDAAKRIATPA
jgi:probable F420-dependent oxidoreductase